MAKILAISGGVGGAKLALGLAQLLRPGELTVCANTADDFTHLGLRICPDLDTVMYTLAGLSDRARGWGLAGESWQFMEQLRTLGGEDWFQLGDRDLAVHVLRSQWLAQGLPLVEVTRRLCQGLGVAHALVPMTEQAVTTMVDTAEGELAFQHYFVRRRCEPAVRSLRFAGIDAAQPLPLLLRLLRDPALDAVLICPSNPFVSVAPVLALPGLRQALLDSAAVVVAVSPIVGGAALKGPAAKMMAELQLPVTAAEVARFYGPLLDGFVVDECDRAQASWVADSGTRCLVTGTVMTTADDKVRLAREVLAFVQDLAQK